MTSKIRIVLLLTNKTKNNQRPKGQLSNLESNLWFPFFRYCLTFRIGAEAKLIHLWAQLSSAKLSCSSEVTLDLVYLRLLYLSDVWNLIFERLIAIYKFVLLFSSFSFQAKSSKGNLEFLHIFLGRNVGNQHFVVYLVCLTSLICKQHLFEDRKKNK